MFPLKPWCQGLLSVFSSTSYALSSGATCSSRPPIESLLHTPKYLGYLAMRGHLPTFLESPPAPHLTRAARCQAIFQSPELGEGLKREVSSRLPHPHPPPWALTASESSNPGT